MRLIVSIFLIQAALNIGFSSIKAQPVNQTQKLLINDSLTLSSVLQNVMQTHPSVKQVEEALNAAEARIGLAKAGYMPDIDVTASYTRLAPVTKFNFPGFGNIQFFPENNYVTALNYRQNIYDFGKTSGNIKLETENKALLLKNVELVKQKLTLITTNTFFSLVFLQDAIIIKDEELRTLKEHLGFIEKRNATGSATKYELLATKVKISTTESQKTDLFTMRISQTAILNSLMGLSVTNKLFLNNEIEIFSPVISQDSLLGYALEHRVEMLIAKEKESLLKMQFNVVKSQNNPVVNVFVSGGGKNGYMPTIDKIQPNFSAGLGIHIPLFDSNRMKNNLLQANSSITSSSYETEIVRRNISNEVIENDANRIAASQKINQYELQLDQAAEAFSLATISFKSGAITNLDLLDAETTVSESRLMLLKAKIEYIVSIFRLKTSLGDKLY